MPSKKARGKRGKTRKKFRKKGPKATVNKLLGTFKEKDSVHVQVDSSVHSGIPPKRIQGKTVKVKGMQGKVYEILLKDGGKQKSFLVHPAHLSKAA